MSGEVVLMTLLGGLGTVFGPVVGALVVIALENYLAQLGAWVTVVQGAIFVVCVLTFRRGHRRRARAHPQKAALDVEGGLDGPLRASPRNSRIAPAKPALERGHSPCAYGTLARSCTPTSPCVTVSC